MVKRKGSEYGQAPKLSIVTSPEPSIGSSLSTPTNDNIDSLLNSPLSTSSHPLQWEDTKDLITKTLQMYDAPTATDGVHLATACLSSNDKLESRKDELHAQANNIMEQIKARTDECSKACMNELNDLHNHRETLKSLEMELNNIRLKNLHLDEKQSTVKERIEGYRAEAKEEVEQIDELEEERKAEVPRLKQQISILATSTGIKWDYNRVDVLAGEIDIPSQKIHKRFLIDMENYSKFEIANKLWDMIEGKGDVLDD